MRAARVALTRRGQPTHLSPSRRTSMETDWYNRAEAIQQRVTQLKDSL
jgi:hypothetical protein